MELAELEKELTEAFCRGFDASPVPADKYTAFRWPRALPLMRFETHRTRLPGFGQLMTMHTRAVMGMELLTCSFMPFEGASVPYLLIDMMTMKKKRTVFVEYYDCTEKKPPRPELEAVAQRYASLPAYREKPAWYVSERTPYSLIKGGAEAEDETLRAMVLDSVRAYREAIETAGSDYNNLDDLINFRERMLNEGNPSSSVMEKVWGKQGAEIFFKACVMPLE